MHSISATNKIELVGGFGWGGYLGRVFPHRASATFGTPSVTAKAVRASKRRWYNCVAALKEYFRLYASIFEILFSRDMRSISPQTNENLLEALGGVTSVVYFRTAYGDYGTPSVTAKAVRAPKKEVAQLRCCAKRVLSIVCKHPRNPLLLRYAQHIHHKQNRTHWRLWMGLPRSCIY